MMSTQSASFHSIPFSITTSQQNVRLLELPPDLLDLITSDNKPQTIELKSCLVSQSNGKSTSQPPHLHLCTASKVWAVKQVSTSNSVHVIQPSSDTITATNDGVLSPNLAAVGLTSTAIPTSHLELVPVNPALPQLLQDISSLVPLYPYNNVEHFDQTIQQNNVPLHSPSNTSPKNDIASHLPYPSNMITPLIRESLIFSPYPGTSTFRPPPALQLTAWRALYQHATSQSIDLAELDFRHAIPLFSQIASEDDEVVAKVAEAITRRFSDAAAAESGAAEKQHNATSDDSLRGRFDGQATALWLGRLLVQCSSQQQRILASELKAQWTALLPSIWEEYCDVKALVEKSGGAIVEEDEFIRFVDPEVREGGSGSTAVGDGASKPAAASTGKRKWHERFGAQRNR